MSKFLLLIYNCILVIFLAPILFAIVLSGKKNRKDFFYCIKERLAVWNGIPDFDKNKKNIWIHCASLGEVRAVEPMIAEIKDANIILTVLTRSAREYASQVKGVSYYAFMPVDLYPFIAKAVKLIKPDILIFVETEFWPGMIYCAKAAGSKIITVNGRISRDAFKYYKMTSYFWRNFLNLIDRILVRNEKDYDRFVSILRKNDNVHVTGNIKYDRNAERFNFNKTDLKYKDDDVIIAAGSTRENEELVLIEVFEKLKGKINGLKLVIAPRYISRIPEIIKILRSKNMKYDMFSQNQKNGEDIMLVDAFGKLQQIYSVSDIVFIGGSIVDRGGQNPVEPSSYAKPVIFGRHMDNFETESKLLLQLKGAFEVSGGNDLYDTLKKLLEDKALRVITGQNALETVKMQRGAILKNLSIINNI